MALIHEAHRLRLAVARGQIHAEAAALELQLLSDGGLTFVGAMDVIENGDGYTRAEMREL